MTDDPNLTRRSVLSGFALLAASGVAHFMVPRQVATLTNKQFNLEDIVPTVIGSWQPEPRIRLVQPDEPDSLEKQVYSQTLAHAYRDSANDLIMLLVAYGPSQSEHLYLHRPELCYAASGFSVSSSLHQEVNWRDGAPPLKVTRMMTRREARIEPVTYWMRVGDKIATNNLEQQMIRLRYGFRGEIPDGALVRVSSFSPNPQHAFEMHDDFLRQFFSVVAPKDLGIFLGSLANGIRPNQAFSAG